MSNIIEEHAAGQTVPQDPMDEFKTANGVYDLDAMVAKVRANEVKIRIGGNYYTVRPVTRKVMKEFQRLGQELKRMEDAAKTDANAELPEAHAIAGRQACILLGTPEDVFDEMDISVVQQIIEFIITKVKGLGELKES